MRIQSAGIIVIDRTNPDAEATVLCVRAYANWDFPKGQLDPGETHVEAAVRELEEETTLSLSDIKLIGLQTPSVKYGSGKTRKEATYFLADRVSQKKPYLPISPELGKPENDEYRWVSASQLKDLMPARLEPVVNYLLGWLS